MKSPNLYQGLNQVWYKLRDKVRSQVWSQVLNQVTESRDRVLTELERVVK